MNFNRIRKTESFRSDSFDIGRIPRVKRNFNLSRKTTNVKSRIHNVVNFSISDIERRIFKK